jgi:methylase of polypeptide subunit release factors
MHLASLITKGHFKTLPPGSSTHGLEIIDFCTGTGCIALLLATLLQHRHGRLQVRAVDVSEKAIQLALENVNHNIRKGHLSPSFAATPGPASAKEHAVGSIRWEVADIFSWEAQAGCRCDIIVCNPPYISPRGFKYDTARSVRNFEPKLAQVPLPRNEYANCRPEDVFYARLLEIGRALRPKIMLFEVGDMEQAGRVVKMVLEYDYLRQYQVEIWRDWPDAMPEPDEAQTVAVDLLTVTAKGSGRGRSVLIYQS